MKLQNKYFIRSSNFFLKKNLKLKLHFLHMLCKILWGVSIEQKKNFPLKEVLFYRLATTVRSLVRLCKHLFINNDLSTVSVK